MDSHEKDIWIEICNKTNTSASSREIDGVSRSIKPIEGLERSYNQILLICVWFIGDDSQRYHVKMFRISQKSDQR